MNRIVNIFGNTQLTFLRFQCMIISEFTRGIDSATDWSSKHPQRALRNFYLRFDITLDEPSARRPFKHNSTLIQNVYSLPTIYSI